MIFPTPLKPNDKIVIISPAGKVKRETVEKGASLLCSRGYQVEIGSSAFAEEGVFAGTDDQRVADLQAALDDENTAAIFCARGGYGSLRTHFRLNWSNFLKKPKWLIGFSDITVFHAFLSGKAIASVHGVMPAFFERDSLPTTSFEKLMEVLSGHLPTYTIAAHPLNRIGEATGTVVGGNLSIIQSLRGTPLDFSPEGKILFIEDLDEYHYHLDRMLMNLKAGGIFEQIEGLVVGYFSNMKDGDTPFGPNAAQIIREAVAGYHFPVLFNFPAGHQLPNMPLLMGGAATLKVSQTQGTLDFSIPQTS